MKKILNLILVLIIICNNVFVVSAEVTAGSKIPGTVEKITIYAEPITDNDTTAVLRLEIINADVMGFEPAIGIMSIPACENRTFIEDGKICADISKGNKYFSRNDILGIITVRWQDGHDQAQINKLAKNGYYDGLVTRYSTGTLSTFDIASSYQTTWFNTNSMYFMLGGIVLIFIGLTLVLYQRNTNSIKD